MKETKGFACLGVIVFTFFSLPIGSLMNGWVLSILWEWFIIPIFNVSSLSIPMAIGFSLVIGFLTKKSSSDENNKNKEISTLVGEVIEYSILYPLFTLALAWVVVQFI